MLVFEWQTRTALPLAAGNEIQECTDPLQLSDPMQVTNSVQHRNSNNSLKLHKLGAPSNHNVSVHMQLCCDFVHKERDVIISSWQGLSVPGMSQTLNEETYSAICFCLFMEIFLITDLIF